MAQKTIASDNGESFIDTELQGRIFTKLDGELLHRFDSKLAANPNPDQFNNIGANSLWPAPEGGPFAFNYLGGDWLVQPAVNTQKPVLTAKGCEKTVELSNRKGLRTRVKMSRELSPLPLAKLLSKYGLRGTGYREKDVHSIAPADRRSPEEFVIAAWSLEQFDLSDGTEAFCCVEGDPRKAVNADFYGDPWPRLKFHDHVFEFRLGGENRLQIGVSMKESPKLIGAYVPSRSLLILRRTPFNPKGKYINIADNDQPKGVYSACDQYSIFNGASLNFFELETISTLELDSKGLVKGSTLHSETMFFKGGRPALAALLKEQFNTTLEVLA